MDQLNILDQKILNVLQNYTLEPYSKQAERLGISPQTMIRRVESLKKKEILRFPIASFIPERLSLSRYGVMFSISSLHQFTLLQNALSEHKYIRAYNRFYGENFGIYAHFDLPPNTEAIFTKYLEYLLNEEYCDSYFIMKSMGYRLSQPEPLKSYSSEPEKLKFDVISFWEKRLNKSTTLPRLPSAIDSNLIEPLHFMLLRDLTTSVRNGTTIDIRSKQTELVKHYRDYYESLAKKIKLTDAEEACLYNLSSFFDTKNIPKNENGKTIVSDAAKVEFGRKYYSLVFNNLITNPRWNFSRKLSEQHVTRAYFIENIPEQEKAQIFRFLNEEKIPFQTFFELFNKGIFLRLSMPPYYDSKINYLIWSSFKDYKIYSLDFFGKHGTYWTFEFDSYDWAKKGWKTDDEWMYDSVIENINYKLANGTYGDYKKNGSYLREHIATNGNGNGNDVTATTAQPPTEITIKGS